MTPIVLTIEGDLCGAMSIGTVAVIVAIAEHLGLPLAEASDYVNRCVFEQKQVTLSAPTRAAADALLRTFAELPAARRIHASISD